MLWDLFILAQQSLYSLWHHLRVRNTILQATPPFYISDTIAVLSAGRFYITGPVFNTTPSILHYILSVCFLFSQLLPFLHIIFPYFGNLSALLSCGNSGPRSFCWTSTVIYSPQPWSPWRRSCLHPMSVSKSTFEKRTFSGANPLKLGQRLYSTESKPTGIIWT